RVVRITKAIRAESPSTQLQEDLQEEARPTLLEDVMGGGQHLNSCQ
ncbi:hypothetical protein A2U01_0071048, partial [Trifolium medium]|nr:hypothetical protein [Trifolium medium]